MARETATIVEIRSDEVISSYNGWDNYAWITVKYSHERLSNNLMQFYVGFVLRVANGWNEAELGMTATIDGVTKTGTIPSTGSTSREVWLGPWDLSADEDITNCSAGLSNIQWPTNGSQTRTWRFTATVDPPNDFTVSYSANGGTGAPEPQLKHYGETLVLSDETPEKEDISNTYSITLCRVDPFTGTITKTEVWQTWEHSIHYNFMKWNTAADGSGTDYFPGDEYTDNADVTLYAQWETETDPIMYYGLPRYSSAGSNSRGFTHKGWGLSQTATSGYWGISVNEFPANTYSMTLYSLWQANSFTVTFNANGGTVEPASKSVTYGSAYGTLPTPVREGFEFLGWYRGVAVMVDPVLVTASTIVTTASNHPLVAHWKAPVELHLKSGNDVITVSSIYSKSGSTVSQVVGIYSVSDGVVKQGV